MVDLARAWRLKAAYFLAQGTGDRLDVLSAESLERVVFEPSGRMIVILTSAARTRAASATDMAALFRSMVAYTGRWWIDGEKFVKQVDGAWDRAGSGPSKSRHFVFDGRTLSVRTGLSIIRHFPVRR